MTAEEWLKCEDPQQLIPFVGRFRPDERKLRLYAVAGCRRVLHLMSDERSRAAVEVAERFADSSATEEERDAAWEAADQATTDVWLATTEDASGTTSNWDSPNMSAAAASNAIGPSEDFVGETAELFYLAANPIDTAHLAVRERGENGDAVAKSECAIHLQLIRDIFGNPFRDVSFNPAWRTDTAVSLARGMYDSREFGAMPILADALQDAGCEDEAILMHCRDANQPHVRGCWVCDLVLGKE
jgi:hypothetical protein